MISIEELLNPASESIIVESLSDEICRSVQQRCHEAELGEAQGADNSEFGDDAVRAKLTRKEVLTAASTIQGYLADINDPFACKLEALLAQFGHETCCNTTKALIPTVITDYFN